jgi:myo-inositol-1(or 4)-monophosphatase
VSEPARPDQVWSGVPSASTLEGIAIGAVAEGARIIRAAAGQLGAVRTKSSPTDPVTALDLEVERIIRESLARSTPQASFLGEEHGDTPGPSALGWILDPIDGTVNLTYDLPVIGVSLAATLDGAVVAGAVVDVLRDEGFSAAAGHGARRDGSTIRPSDAHSLAASLVATGFDYSADGRAREAECFRRVLPVARDVRCFGSAALHLCWVACGRLDAFYQRNMKSWDYAAGALIAIESGARVEHPTPQNGELMVVASPRIFDPVHQLVV